ncbi:hypothetical protein Tdes44962_MAKER03363 [Teratosphaeria destructans]|uniref:Uncharacterized protein n=1 Tax=Teratosphaeria destructans TaxID=418781 RepID=A0A9W7SQD3_9PEZI|nr:hypothetical protein Tdes44962_MAKER03363 [Teratosphaeria destructans]
MNLPPPGFQASAEAENGVDQRWLDVGTASRRLMMSRMLVVAVAISCELCTQDTHSPVIIIPARAT